MRVASPTTDMDAPYFKWLMRSVRIVYAMANTCVQSLSWVLRRRYRWKSEVSHSATMRNGSMPLLRIAIRILYRQFDKPS